MGQECCAGDRNCINSVPVKALMEKIRLDNIDADAIQDVLGKIERSFGIRFGGEELLHIFTFSGLCELIIKKIGREHREDCTSQQAFYKLRDALCSVLAADRQTITPELQLAALLPKRRRRTNIARIEKELGLRLSILEPPGWVSVSLLLVLLTGFILLFFNWPIGLIALLAAIAGFQVANRTGATLSLKTVGQVAEKMAAENYRQSRRKQETVNRAEIEKVLIELFSEEAAPEAAVQADSASLPVTVHLTGAYWEHGGRSLFRFMPGIPENRFAWQNTGMDKQGTYRLQQNQGTYYLELCFNYAREETYLFIILDMKQDVVVHFVIRDNMGRERAFRRK